MIPDEDMDKLPLTAHLEELRTRLIRSFIAIAMGAGVAYMFKEKLFEIIVSPLIKVLPPENHLIFTGLPEAFFTYLKLSVLVGILFAVPVITFEFWMFVAPGLYKREKLMLMPVIFLSTVFFVGGALFGYFIVFPWGFKFFLGFSTESIQALPSMKEYLSFASKMLIAFGLVFELPIIITFMARLGIVTTDFLRKNRKYAIVLFFIGGAILTPPDVVTQVMMAGPLWVLYEISILGAMVFGKKKEEATQSDAADDEAD